MLDLAGREILAIPGRDGSLEALLDAEGRRAISSGDGGVVLWNVRAGSSYARIHPRRAEVRVAGGGRRVLLWDAGRVRLHLARFEELLALAETRLPPEPPAPGER